MKPFTRDSSIPPALLPATSSIAGYLVGFKAWHVEVLNTSSLTQEPILVPKYSHAETSKGSISLSPIAWPKGKALIANCLVYPIEENSTHRAPAPNCSCGIYAFYNLKELDASLYIERKKSIFESQQPEPCSLVVGAVIAWGKIQLHQEGFRAEFGKPIALTGDGISNVKGNYWDFVERVANSYGVPNLKKNNLVKFAKEFGTINPKP